MKIIYSQLKQFLPDLKHSAKKIAEDLTWIGHFCDGFEQKDDEEIISLEIRSNRGDCLGYLGLARELAILYNLDLKIPQYSLKPTSSPLNIKVDSLDVKRVMAIKIRDLHLAESSSEIKKFLKLHQIGLNNNIVDLTNYIMLLYGIPCHAFSLSNDLIWENLTTSTTFTTLDGSKINLPPTTLVISHQQQPTCLSFIGGQNSGIQLNTKEAIIEMAVYNPTRVRLDSKKLNLTTEASLRLDKELDPDLIPTAFNHLIKLILNHSKGHIDSALYDYYPNKTPHKNISLTINPSAIAGIKIPDEFSQKIINKIDIDHRSDIESAIDLVEEIIRFWGFNKIPTDQPVNPRILPDITPQILKNIETLKSELLSRGFNEVKTKPLTNKKYSKSIATQNNINANLPYLRTNLTDSLEEQLNQYLRLKIPLQPFFEIGKIYYQENNNLVEKYALGTFDGKFHETIIDDTPREFKKLPDTFFNAYEITSQIICLDANLISSKTEKELLAYYRKAIGNILWDIKIIDHYRNKYTFRVWYFNCDDKTAKQIHLKTFKLTKIQRTLSKKRKNYTKDKI
ncbi:MAG TPA: phenylalanine--tRNA ligase beta subunit-related protein [Candidatus Woesebacteria bacterium]|nr:phenylalanine--tRNA ligase beta subunit-related protein [Candidatus Woesebacteria bacterium]HRT40215.1 phenylalanine--tRNA ligase beta subunit-related protein [Candidatus Woesebacteria bacterium]